MILVLGSIGWGLLAIGAATHLWHHDRLRDLLAMHTDHERPVAALLVAVEVLLAIALPIAVVAQASWRVPAAAAAAFVGVGFAVWIARLLTTGSELPCACSFSSGPTSPWSLVRAAVVILSGLLIVSLPDRLSTSDVVSSLVVGLAVAAALFVLPEALTWPEASRAQLTRIESHRPDRRTT